MLLRDNNRENFFSNVLLKYGFLDLLRIDVQQLRILRSRIMEKVQNEILRPVYKNEFFNILLHSLQI